MSSKYPKISVITPSYNQGDFLEQTILSVLDQDYPELEYMVIDGGSTDSSLEIIKRYKDRLAFWVSEKDKGQSEAINKGFRRATGEIICWLNSDDYFEPGCLKEVAKTFLQTGADIVLGDLRYIRKHEQEILVTGEFDRDRLWGKNYIPQPATFIKRELLEKYGYLKEELHCSMDYELWLRLSLKAEVKFAYCPRILANFRLHPDSKTTKDRGKFINEVMGIFRDFLSQEDLPLWVKNVAKEKLAWCYCAMAIIFVNNRKYLKGAMNICRAFMTSSFFASRFFTGKVLSGIRKYFSKSFNG